MPAYSLYSLHTFCGLEPRKTKVLLKILTIVRDMWRSGTKRLRVPFGRTVLAQTVLQMTKRLSFNTVLNKDTAHSETSVSFGNGQTTKKNKK